MPDRGREVTCRATGTRRELGTTFANARGDDLLDGRDFLLHGG
jgi:hypothetical protein